VELVDEQSGILISDKKLDHVIEQFEIFKSRERDKSKISETMRGKLVEQQ
jgi:hypothetical protein